MLPLGARPIVHDGQEVKAGDPITDGPFDPKELMEIKGIRETQLYLVEEVQQVYRDQGVSIHDKHIELIVRQMTRRIGVQEPGDTDFLPGERVDAKVFRDTNRRMVEEGKRPAEGRPEIMGITKASLATESWLSAASFQETTRVLTEAAIDGRGDSLIGLKENIIIGKLIPAGTGMMRYREFDIEAPDYQPMTFYSSDAEERTRPPGCPASTAPTRAPPPRPPKSEHAESLVWFVSPIPANSPVAVTHVRRSARIRQVEDDAEVGVAAVAASCDSRRHDRRGRAAVQVHLLGDRRRDLRCREAGAAPRRPPSNERTDAVRPSSSKCVKNVLTTSTAGAQASTHRRSSRTKHVRPRRAPRRRRHSGAQRGKPAAASALLPAAATTTMRRRGTR